jgi:hypothetical protein
MFLNSNNIVYYIKDWHNILKTMCALMNVHCMTGGNHKYTIHITNVEKSRFKKNKVELKQYSKDVKIKCDFNKCINKQPNCLFYMDKMFILSDTLNTDDVSGELDWFDGLENVLIVLRVLYPKKNNQLDGFFVV